MAAESAAQPHGWPEYAVVFDCETRIDTSQDLTFGFYRVLRLHGDTTSSKRRERSMTTIYRLTNVRCSKNTSALLTQK